MDKVHVVATFTRAIDAAFRGYGFNVISNMQAFRDMLNANLNDLELLHQVGLGGQDLHLQASRFRVPTSFYG